MMTDTPSEGLKISAFPPGEGKPADPEAEEKSILSGGVLSRVWTWLCAIPPGVFKGPSLSINLEDFTTISQT